MSYEVSVSLLKAVIHGATQMGLDVNEVARKSDIDISVVDDPELRIACVDLCRFFDTAVELSEDPYYGLHHAEHFQPTSMTIVGYVCMNAPTIRSGYKELLNYERIIGNSLKNVFIENKESGFVEIQLVDAVERHFSAQLYEKLLMEHVTAIRSFVGSNTHPKAVYFKHVKPSSTKEHERLFQCPVYFEQESCKLEFSNETLDTKILHADPHLYQMLQKSAMEILKKIEDTTSISHSVSKEILSTLHGGEPSIEKVASRLNHSVRTLQRRLKEENTSYNELLNGIRKEVATRHLRERSLSISDISYLLGFSEPSVFHRSFKKWVGKTPKRYRLEYSG